jgi:hypothetical protein
MFSLTVSMPKEQVLHFETLKWMEQEFAEQNSKISLVQKVRKPGSYLKEAIFHLKNRVYPSSLKPDWAIYPLSPLHFRVSDK